MKNFGKTTDIRDIITVGYEADNAVLYSTSQSLTDTQKTQARTNIGAGTSNFDGDYDSLTHKPTIPKKTSQLENDSNFATTSQVEARYTKPPEGIPKTDLATAVQNSLTAADNAVKYTSQSLTDAQKKQARNNIGAGTSNFSGNYKDLADKPPIPPEVSIVQSTGESTSSVMSQKATTNAVNGRLSKTDNTNIEVLGTKKATTTLGGNQLYAPSGVIFGGTAAAAGLVTRGICGVTTPSDGGACSKENLYINYDGNNDFNAGRQVVLNAGTVGNHLGSNMYQYTVPRGEIVKNWVEAKGYATSVKVNGNTIASSGGVVDIGTVLTDASKFATSAQGTKADNAMPKKGGTFTGEVKFGSTENFQGYYIKRMIGSLGAGTAYNNLDSLYKDGTYHRMWRLRFPNGSSFWGKIKITLYGGYSSFNASGVMSKSITCNFNTSNIYNNVGCYDGLGVNVEQDFRISEAIWNATVSAWEVLIWQKNLNGNNSPTIMLECWTTNNTNYINAFNGIAAQTVELTQSTSYSAQKASPTGGTKTVKWATLPVYENPLGEEIATMSDLSNKANLNGGNTFSGVQTINAPTNVDGSEQTTMKVKTSNGGAIIFGKEGANSGTMIRLDQADGTCRLRFRSSATAGAMVWEQPEKGAKLHVDLGKDGSDKHRITFPSHGGTLALTSQLPTVNNGTLTIQKNGTKVQTFTANQSSSVTANITVPTKTSEITNDSGFITSDGSVKSVIDYNNANNRIKIGYSGDGLSGDSIKYIAGYTTGDSESAARIKDINKDALKSWLGYATVATSGSYNDLSDKPDISGKANLAGGNTFTGKQTLNSPASDGYSIDAAGYVKGSWLQASATSNKGANTGKVCVFDNSGWIYYRTPKEVIIDAECAVKYELKKTINFGRDGALYIGKFKVYDTNVTFEVTSTTSVTYSGKLVIATQNYVIREAKVYGDAANTVAPNIYIKPSTTSDPYIEVYFKPESWSKNVIHIYGSEIKAEPTDVCTNIPSIPATATLKPKNALDSKANVSDIPTLQWVTPTSVNEIKSAILWKVTDEKSADKHGGIEIAIGSGQIGNGSGYNKYNSANYYGLCNVNIISDSQTFVELIPFTRSVPNQQYRTNIVLSDWKILKLG